MKWDNKRANKTEITDKAGTVAVILLKVERLLSTCKILQENVDNADVTIGFAE